jgi:hypothetical protein
MSSKFWEIRGPLFWNEDDVEIDKGSHLNDFHRLWTLNTSWKDLLSKTNKWTTLSQANAAIRTQKKQRLRAVGVEHFIVWKQFRSLDQWSHICKSNHLRLYYKVHLFYTNFLKITMLITWGGHSTWILWKGWTRRKDINWNSIVFHYLNHPFKQKNNFIGFQQLTWDICVFNNHLFFPKFGFFHAFKRTIVLIGVIIFGEGR